MTQVAEREGFGSPYAYLRAMPARLVAALLAALLVPLPALAAVTPPPLRPIRMAFVSGAAGFGDHSFNDEVAAALRACTAGTATPLQLLASHDPADYVANLVLAATQNVDEVVGIGPGMARPVDETAIRFGASHFSLIDGVADQPNAASYVFHADQGAFLAGALAAMVSKSGRLAFLGAKPVPAAQTLAAAFAAGARYAVRAVNVSVSFAGSFTDAPAARAATAKLFAGGADVIMVSAGPASLGAIAEARTRRTGYLIGADVDQDALAPGADPDERRQARRARRDPRMPRRDRPQPVSGAVAMDLANGGVSLTRFAYTEAAVPACRPQAPGPHPRRNHRRQIAVP